MYTDYRGESPGKQMVIERNFAQVDLHSGWHITIAGAQQDNKFLLNQRVHPTFIISCDKVEERYECARQLGCTIPPGWIANNICAEMAVNGTNPIEKLLIGH